MYTIWLVSYMIYIYIYIYICSITIKLCFKLSILQYFVASLVLLALKACLCSGACQTETVLTSEQFEQIL